MLEKPIDKKKLKENHMEARKKRKKRKKEMKGRQNKREKVGVILLRG
jgi:hypothetical protein